MRLTTLLGAAILFSGAASAQDLVYAFEGDSGGDQLGSSVAGVGDVSGDGLPDLLVGSFGDPLRQARAFSGADGAFLFALNSSVPGEQFGRYVAGLGDLDVDGYGDFAISAPLGGYTRVFSGQNQTLLYEFNVPSQRIVNAGDTNADGFDDLAIGGGNAVRLYSGATGAPLWQWSGTSSFGVSLDGAGDVNGDGYDDVIVGSYFENGVNGPEAGRARVYSGFDGSLLHLFEGLDDYHWFGETVAGAGDVNGDGFDDVMATAEIEHLFVPDNAYARVFSGLDGALLHHIAFPGCLGLTGAAVDGAGDVDGDGLGDFLVGGEPACTSGDQFLRLYSGADAAVIWELDSAMSHQSLDQAGDVDGDGIPELVLGHQYDDGVASSSGRAEVRRLSCAPLPYTYCIGAPSSAGPGASIGWSGSLSVSQNALELNATGCVPVSFGIFYYGPQEIQLPFGDGFRCVGAGGIGIFRINPPVQTDGSGDVALVLDFAQPPLGTGPGRIAAGDTWNFQYWYRDVPAGLSGFNLTDAVSLTFCR